MTHLPHSHLKVALLFDNHDHFGRTFPRWPAVLNALNANLAPEAHAFRLLKCSARDRQVVLSNPEYHVIAERVDAPIDQSEFASVTAQELYIRHDADLLEAVRDHRCAILISVGAGPKPAPARPIAETPDENADERAEKFQRQMQVLQAASLAFYDFFMPSAVHWSQSDQLFAGPRFTQLARREFSPVLYLNPDFFSSGAEIDGAPCLGLLALGAQDILGKSLIVEENPNPGMDSYKLAVSFALVCRHFGRVLDTGETFRCAAGAPPILVTHAPANAQHRNGVITLRPASGNETTAARPRRRTATKTMTVRAPVLAARIGPPPQQIRTVRRWGAMAQAALILGCVYLGSGLFNQTVSAHRSSLTVAQLLELNSDSYAKLSAPAAVSQHVLASAGAPASGQSNDF